MHVKRDEGCDGLAVDALAAPPPRRAGEGAGPRASGTPKGGARPGAGRARAGGGRAAAAFRGARPAKCGADSNDDDDDDDDDKNKNDNNSNSSNVLCQRAPPVW